jgi:hypothetical protein
VFGWLCDRSTGSPMPRQKEWSGYCILGFVTFQSLWNRCWGGMGAVVFSAFCAWAPVAWAVGVGTSADLMSAVLCVCVCVMPNHFNKSKAFAIIQHLSTAMSVLQQCLDVRPMRPFLPLSTTRRLCTVVMRLPHPAAPPPCAP